MNHRIGRQKYGPLRNGQYWKKIDTGRVMVIVARTSDDCWSVTFLQGGTNKAHHLKERDIYKYYEKL